MKSVLPLALVLLGLSACASDGSPQVSPPPAPALTVQVTPNLVEIGQALSFRLGFQDTSGSVFLALFVEYPDGRVGQLLPNRLPGGEPTVKAGQSVTFPPVGATYELQATGPTGIHTVLAYASWQPLKLDDFSSYASAGAAFATVHANRQGKGSLEASFVAKMKLLNSGLHQFTTFEVKTITSSAP